MSVGRHSGDEKHRRHWLLLALPVVVGITAAGVLLSRSAAPPSDTAASIEIQSTLWRVGSEAELTLRTVPPRTEESISLTLLAPGAGQPQVHALTPAYFGLSGVQLLWLPQEYRETEIALAAAAGARYIGLDLDWRSIEPHPGVYEWEETDDVVALAKRYDLRLLPMLLYTPRWASIAPFAPLDYQRAPPADYDSYRDFVYAVVDRYKPHGASSLTSDGYGVTDWAMWNEPNTSSDLEAPSPGDFWPGTIEAYIHLLRAGYEGAHAADPHCNVLNGALADVFWAESESDLVAALERFYDPDGDGDTADGGRPFFDTLNVHTYQLGTPDSAWYETRLEAIRQVMERFGDEQKPIWITETGYGSAAVPPADSSYVDEETQAAAVRLIYETCSAYPQVERVFWWSLRSYYSDASASNQAMEAHYGLLRANFAPKPAYLAYARLTGSVSQVLTLTAVADENGAAHVIVPASFVARPGDYIVFATLDETVQTAVAFYRTAPGVGTGQD